MNDSVLFNQGLKAEKQKDYRTALNLYEQAARRGYFPAKTKANQMKKLIIKDGNTKDTQNTNFYVECNEEDIVYNVLEDMVYTKRELREEGKEILIVNAGRMNHGKSSLLNSLLQKEIFETADVRLTRVRQKEEYSKNVFVIDTPGLDADEKDDAEAFEVYKKANFILFVHSLKIGELHKSEIDIILKLKNMFPKGYFWDHFALALTFGDTVDDENYESIKSKIQADIGSVMPDNTLKIFFISNKRFEKGINEKNKKERETFIEKSGIPLLKAFINEHIPVWGKENVILQQDRFDQAKGKSVKKLEENKSAREENIKQIREKYDSLNTRVKSAFEFSRSHVKDRQNSVKGRVNELSKLEQELYKLEQDY